MLTLNVTLLIHHPFITSAHPRLSIIFVDPRHGLCLFLILPIPNR